MDILKKILIFLLLTSSIANSEELYEFFYNLSNQSNEIDLKIDFLKKSIKFNSNYKPAYKRLSEIYINNGNSEKSEKIMQQYFQNIKNKNSSQNKFNKKVNSKQNNHNNKSKFKSYLKNSVIVLGIATASTLTWYYWDDITSIFIPKKISKKNKVIKHKNTSKKRKTLKPENSFLKEKKITEKNPSLKNKISKYNLNSITKDQLLKIGADNNNADLIIKYRHYLKNKNGIGYSKTNELYSVPLIDKNNINIFIAQLHI